MQSNRLIITGVFGEWEAVLINELLPINTDLFIFGGVFFVCLCNKLQASKMINERRGLSGSKRRMALNYSMASHLSFSCRGV